MAIMWDGLCGGMVEHFAHWPSGGNVLYMTGQVKWQRFDFLKKEAGGTVVFNDAVFPFGATGFAIHNMEALAWNSFH